MSFSERQADPRRHLAGFTFVILSHVFVVYARVTGLAAKVVAVVRGLTKNAGPGDALGRVAFASNGMDAPTRNGINVPKWKRYFNHLNREGRPS